MRNLPRSSVRRALLRAVALACAPLSLRARAQVQELPEIPALRGFLAGRSLRWEGVTIETPRLADNGNSVSVKLAASLREPVTTLHLFSERNPVPVIAVFHFAPDAPRIQLETRVRLGGSQRMVVVASTASGAVYGAMAEVIVTIAACIEGT